jgi:GGDEF domain-containing protein
MRKQVKPAAPQEPRTFKKVKGPFRVEGDAYGPFTALAARFAGEEFIVLVRSVAAAEQVLRALGVQPDNTKAERVAVVKCDAMKRIKE